MNNKLFEYGDWQTNEKLAAIVTELIKNTGFVPQVIFEPTAGVGNFLFTAIDTFISIKFAYAVEINHEYIDIILKRASRYKDIQFLIHNQSIFNFNFNSLPLNKEILIIGNPPWVTNSDLGLINSSNLPKKSNFKNHKGLDAITGKGNFDIAEYIVLQILNACHNKNGILAILLKNSVIRNIISEQKQNNFKIGKICQYEIDTKKEFGANTNASLFMCHLNCEPEYECNVYNIYDQKFIRKFGLLNNKLVFDLSKYSYKKNIEGVSPLIWRSGIKHDCSKVMELKKTGEFFSNGFNENLKLENDYVYPLLKSSDLKGGIIETGNKSIIITQKSTSDNTNYIKNTAPLTYDYLLQNSNYLDSRKSIIYKKNFRFSIFGVGEYSFKRYKVAISSMYKKFQFTLIISKDKPIMLDDTCYFLAFDNYKFAFITYCLLNHKITNDFINSVALIDGKRKITKSILMRIDLLQCAKLISHTAFAGISETDYQEYIEFLSPLMLFN